MDPPDDARGHGYLCFDASPLIDYNTAGRLPELASWFQNGTCFTANVITDVEIRRGLAQYPENRAILDAPWLQSVAVFDDDLDFVVSLRQLWGSPGDRDYGEAEVVALCRRYGWTAVMNDRRGRAAAANAGVAHISTAGMAVAVTAEGILTANAGWELHQAIEGSYNHPMILPTGDDFRPAFNRAVAAVRRWTADNPDLHWPFPMAMEPMIDTVLARAVAYERHK